MSLQNGSVSAKSFSGVVNSKIFIATVALVMSSMIVYPIITNRNAPQASYSQSANSLDSLTETDAASNVTVESTAEVMNVQPNGNNTNQVEELPEGFSVKNVEGSVDITVRPKTSVSVTNEKSVKTNISSSEHTTIKEGETTIKYDPDSGEPTTIVQGGSKSVNKTSNFSLNIKGNGTDTNERDNEIEIENDTRIRIRGDSP